MISTAISYQICITGLVQGVGFRPFIYKLATKYHLSGTVDNRNEGVIIHISGEEDILNEFVEAIPMEAPPAANIQLLKIEYVEYESFSGFSIKKSDNNIISNEITEISPDIAVCADCLQDIKSQPHRQNYSFTNCTNCGPRFTIINGLPYDRPNTSMADFELCDSCFSEYSDVNDRRFHAQPVACNHCGPHFSLYYKKGVISQFSSIVSEIASEIDNESNVVIKGMGGFNIICDAYSANAVSELRKIKHRRAKPLAVMFKDIDALRLYCSPSNQELQLLESWRRPIVIMAANNFPNSLVSSGFSTLGVLLPYMPFHYQLFDAIGTNALIFTSANLSGAPIITDNAMALETYSGILPVLTYNREIVNRVDDSLCKISNEQSRLIRRSRSYAPSPIRLAFSVDGILAVGAELENCFCIGKASQAILSQYIGDLKNADTFDFYESCIQQYSRLYKYTPKRVVCDFHPNYLSSQYAENTTLPILKVQHHHAHMASVMAENNLQEIVLGVILDGTGYGVDGTIWGGEFFVGNYNSYERFAHFAYRPIPGGDAVIKQPWRTALSYLYYIYAEDIWNLDIPFVQNLNREKASLIIQMINKNINAPLTSSAGRLFDAVSALLGLCLESDFHAEAPMRLEDSMQQTQLDLSFPFDFENGEINFDLTFKALVNGIMEGESIPRLATMFHNTIVEASAYVCVLMRQNFDINKVVLSGGSFQNAYLSSQLENKLDRLNFEVYCHHNVPTNDGGIALGQIAIAANSTFDDKGVKDFAG